MKIRNGFVSNSSSSSFVILGKKIQLSDVDFKKSKKGNFKYYANTGISYEGEMFVEIEDKKMIDVLQRAIDGEFDDNCNGVEVYEVYAEASDNYGDSGKIKKSELPDTFSLYVFTADQNGYCDAEELEQMYKGEY